MSFIQQTKRTYTSTVVLQVGNSDRSRNDKKIKPVALTVDLQNGLVEEELEEVEVTAPEAQISKPGERDVAPEFIIKPRRQLADEGDSTKFKASFEGSSNTQVTWSKDGKEILPDDHYKMFVKDDFHYLEIEKVLPEHGGSYTCVLSNPAGSTTATVGLEVFEKAKPVKVAQPILIKPLEDQSVTAGDRDVKLTCSVKDADAATVTWFKDGKELRQGRQHRIRFDGRVASLGLTQADPTDGGLYECVIKNNGHEVRTSASLTVENDKREPPYFVQELEDMEVDDGDKVELVVEVKGSEPIDVFWIHNNKEVAKDDPDYQQMAISNNRFKLTIGRVVPGDAGSYVCEAYNEFGDTDTFCNLSIREIEKSLPPDFIMKPKLTKVTEGADAIFSCTVVGFPLPNVYWERNGKILQDSTKYQISQINDKHTLVISKATKDDGGKYVCRLDNQMVSMVHSTSLIVQEKSANTTDFRSVLKKRPSLDAVKPLKSTDRDRPDKENGKKSAPVFQGFLSKMDDTSKHVSHKPKPKVAESHTALRNKFELNSCPKNSDVPKAVKIVPVKEAKCVKRPVAELKPFNHSGGLSSQTSKPQQHSRPDTSDIHLTDKYIARPVQITPVSTTLEHKPVNMNKTQNMSRFHEEQAEHKTKTKDSGLVDFRKEARIKPMEIKKPPEDVSSKPKQVDFRNVLKSKDKNTVKKPKDSVDFRSVLKPKDPMNLPDCRLPPSGVQHDFRHLLSKKSELSTEPKLLQTLTNQTVKYGGQAVLFCEVGGKPDPVIQWSVNQKEIQQSRYLQLKYKDNIASLTINEAFSEDEGEYAVVASNCNGSITTSCTLSIEDSSSMSSRSDSRSLEGPVSFPPKILNVTPTTVSATKNKSTEIKAAFNGEPTPTISWYKYKHELESEGRVLIKTFSNSSVLKIDDLQQADSGKYTIIAENDLGYDKAKIFISVEDVPYSPMGCPSVSEITSNAVSLAWYGPAYDGGSPITAYTVECCKENSRKWTQLTSTCRNTFYQAQGLEPNTQYCFRIRAGNKHGMSEASEPSELITTYEDCSTTLDYESDGYSEVFSPGLESIEDELPFEPKYVQIDKSRKFEEYFDTMEEIGRGKFGNVFKCKDKKTNKIWAAKIVKCREKEKDNIRNEINVMNKLHHPKVLMLWDAFEATRNMVLVMEYIQGGELFERVISDDFELTEGDVIHFMRQICDGLGYIHQQNVLHLDLKPENILCISSKTNQIKIIDFGLAQNFQRGESVKVLFGTPEFIAPEVVNYDEISFATDLWSVGVICYVLLSGLSPFLGDSENETLSNVTLGEYDFDDDAFTEISDNAKDFIQKLLIKKKEKRYTIDQCKNHQWLAQDEKRIRCKRLNTEKLKHFMARRKWQKTGMAIRALGRMASLKNMFSNSSMGSVSSSISNLDDSGVTDSSSSSKQTSVSSPSAVSSEETTFSFDETPSTCTTNTTATTHQNTSASPQPKPPSTATNYKEVIGQQTSPKTFANSRSKDSNVETVSPVGKLTKNGLSRLAKLTDFHSAIQSDESSSGSLEFQQSETSDNSVCLKDNNDQKCSNKQQIQSGTDFIAETNLRSPENKKFESVKSQSNYKVEVSFNKKTNSVANPNKTITSRDFDTCVLQTETSRQIHDLDKRVEKLDLNGADTVDSSIRPCFVKEMLDCEAFCGDVIRFDVVITNFSKVDWYFEDDLITQDKRHIIDFNEDGRCSLIIRQVTTEDDGEYTCTAVNTHGQTSCYADLIVCGAGAI